MNEKSWEKFVKKIEKEEEIKNIKAEYYAKIDSEISEKMQQTTNHWKNVCDNQRKINYKQTGIHETNLERKHREESQERKINYKQTGIHETNLERKHREASSRENKLMKRNQQVENLLRKKEGVFCIFCKTRSDKNGFCYC